MNTKLIKLEDGTVVEVETQPGESGQISGGMLRPIQDATIDNIKPVLSRISAACAELKKDMNIEQAEIELGLSFEAEGNLFVTKSKANANLVVKLTLKPKE